MPNTFELWPINKLINKSFYVPSYQRGYRWTSKEIKDLLEDIYEFIGRGGANNNGFYCLQPIVVKKRDDGRFDVIDGQQRLTTILIILKYLGKGKTYSIEYETRPNSKAFLDDLENLSEKEASHNIDYFFILNAYKTVSDWFDNKMTEKEEYSLPDEFSVALMKYCDVIWYEVDETASAEAIFTRLNIGKIPLTNSELIRALLLDGSNFVEENDVYLSQLEIANEWDGIEHSLQNDKLWYFINPGYSVEPPTRIEYIFDIIADDEVKNNQYDTFLYFMKRVKTEKVPVKEIWKQVKAVYQIIDEWYSDKVLFHKIGFLCSSSESSYSFRDILEVYSDNELSKRELIDLLDQYIKEVFEYVEIEQLLYGCHDSIIKSILLLFNVLTVLDDDNLDSKFRFDLFNKSKWSLEHIHAQNAEGIRNSRTLWKAWIDEHIASFREFGTDEYIEIVRRLESVDVEQLSSDGFDELFNEICESPVMQNDYGVGLDSIDNLALLDVSSNSILSNSFFDVKRRKIIEMDRMGKSIPVCSRNVFLKYYSDDPSQFRYWSQKDRECYLKAICARLSPYLPVEENENV